MKVRFSPAFDNYIGSYHDRKNIKTIVKPKRISRDQLNEEYRKLDYDITCIDLYMGNNCTLLVDHIRKDQYEKLVELIAQDKYSGLSDYTEDLASVVAFLDSYKKEGIKHVELTFAKDAIEHNKDFEAIENFLKEIEHEQLDIENITITASLKAVKRDAVITNATLMKILLNGFARELYLNYYGYDEEIWFQDIVYSRPAQVDKKRPGKPSEIHAEYRGVIAEAFFNMLYNEGLIEDWNKDGKRAGRLIALFCDLCEIADFINDGHYTKDRNPKDSLRSQIKRMQEKTGVKITEPPTLPSFKKTCSLRDFIIHEKISGKMIKAKKKEIAGIGMRRPNNKIPAHIKWFVQLNRYRAGDIRSIIA